MQALAASLGALLAERTWQSGGYTADVVSSRGCNLPAALHEPPRGAPRTWPEGVAVCRGGRTRSRAAKVRGAPLRSRPSGALADGGRGDQQRAAAGRRRRQRGWRRGEVRPAGAGAGRFNVGAACGRGRGPACHLFRSACLLPLVPAAPPGCPTRTRAFSASPACRRQPACCRRPPVAGRAARLPYSHPRFGGVDAEEHHCVSGPSVREAAALFARGAVDHALGLHRATLHLVQSLDVAVPRGGAAGGVGAGASAAAAVVSEAAGVGGGTPAAAGGVRPESGWLLDGGCGLAGGRVCSGSGDWVQAGEPGAAMQWRRFGLAQLLTEAGQQVGAGASTQPAAHSSGLVLFADQVFGLMVGRLCTRDVPLDRAPHGNHTCPRRALSRRSSRRCAYSRRARPPLCCASLPQCGRACTCPSPSS